MSLSRAPSAADRATEATWRDLEHLLDEVLQLAVTATSGATFPAALLDRAMRAVAAPSGSLWKLPPPASASCGLVCELSRGEPSALDGPSVLRALHEEDDSAQTARFFGPTTALCPIRTDGRLRWVLEVAWPRELPADARRNTLNVLAAFGEAAVEFCRRRDVEQLHARLDTQHVVDAFAATLQRQSRPAAIHFTLANECRRLLAADRVIVLTAEGDWRATAISNVDTIDRRSGVVRAAEKLARTIAGETQPQWIHALHDIATEDMSPAWEAFLEAGTSRSLAMLPLQSRPNHAAAEQGEWNSVGLMLVERFAEQPFDLDTMALAERLTWQAAAALTRVLESRQRSLFGWLRRRAVKLTLCGLVLAGVIAAGFMPIDFDIAARGALQPVAQREVFAPADGVVSRLRVRDGEVVAAGAELFDLQNDELDFQITRLHGELQTARQQLQSVQAARLDAIRPGDRAPSGGQLAAEEERLKQVLSSLEEQHRRRLKQRDELVVRSPIAGRIVTWNVEQSLRERPLRRGQRLCTIADESSGWELRIRVADRDVGHVLAARRKTADVPVSFELATAPNAKQQATLHHVADWADSEATDRPSVLMIASIADAKSLAARPGATATARIHCGRQPLGFVWFRDLIALVREKLWM